MNGRAAKEIRKKIYGVFSFRHRVFSKNNQGMILADFRRAEYQAEKKKYVQRSHHEQK